MSLVITCLSVLSMLVTMNLFTFNKIVPPLYVRVYICHSGLQIVSCSTALLKDSLNNVTHG